MKLHIKVAPGKHDKSAEIDKQVNDKERVAAAMENETVSQAIEELIEQERFSGLNRFVVPDGACLALKDLCRKMEPEQMGRLRLLHLLDQRTLDLERMI